MVKDYGPERVTRTVTRGSLYVAITLTGLLVTYDIFNGSLVRTRFWIGCAVVMYLIVIRYILRKHHVIFANWLIILLYELLAALVLLHWGLNSPVGILTASFTILLPGILMSPRSILPVTLVTSSILFMVHIIHSFGVITPTIYVAPSPSNLLDVIAYITILSVFALVSWISARQSSLSLSRALYAEEKLRKQKDSLATELERESTLLRQTQLQQIQQLHRFAIIGQSAIATLHELSNHLSILNLDIDDLKQHVKHSKAIASAEDGIEHINHMVRKARAHLDAQDNIQTFNALPVINRAIKDMQTKFQRYNLKLIKRGPKHLTSFYVHGDPLSLIQCISILLTNAFDACKEIPGAKITTAIISQKGTLIITVTDTGPGISKTSQKSLFQPRESTKSSGLGVGLYIAKHIIESQYNGTLKFLPTEPGATFQITLNRASTHSN